MSLITLSSDKKYRGISLTHNASLISMTSNEWSLISATESKDEGKWYWEVYIGQHSQSAIGVGTPDSASTIDGNGAGMGLRMYRHDNHANYGLVIDKQYKQDASWLPKNLEEGEILGVALDINRGYIDYYVDGWHLGRAFEDINELGEITPMIAMYGGGGHEVNFGSKPFEFPIPEGYLPYDNDNAVDLWLTPNYQYKAKSHYVANEVESETLKVPKSLVPGDSVLYNYTNKPLPIELPAGRYLVEMYGASGGDSSYGGLGMFISAMIETISYDKLYAYIGSSGAEYDAWNGAGIGYNSTGGGGGSTDLRLIKDRWDGTDSLRSRIMVAGAGGGNYGSANGGDAGGLVGSDGQESGTGESGQGGSQTQGGAGGNYGRFGAGGNKLATVSYGGGGGGGYYGGGGTTQTSSNNSKGAGGGSSFISGYSGCNALDKDGKHTYQPIHDSGIELQRGYMETAFNRGHGSIRFTMIEPLEGINRFEIDQTRLWTDKSSKVAINLNLGSETGEHIEGGEAVDGTFMIEMNGKEVHHGNFESKKDKRVLLDLDMRFEKRADFSLTVYTKEKVVTGRATRKLVLESRDSQSFNRHFNPANKDYKTSGSVKLTMGDTPKLTGAGAGNIVTRIPTEGKSKIKNVEVLSRNEPKPIIPSLHRNEQQGFKVSSSSTFDSSYYANKAFNGSTHSASDSWRSTNSSWRTQWLKAELPVEYEVFSYGIERGTTGYGPRDWTLQGSNDDRKWDVLDTQAGIDPGVRYQEAKFQVENPGNYRYYRLNITDKNGSAHYVEVGELNLYGVAKEMPAIEFNMSSTKGDGDALIYRRRIIPGQYLGKIKKIEVI